MSDLTIVTIIGFGVLAFLLFYIASVVEKMAEALDKSGGSGNGITELLSKISGILEEEISWKSRDGSLSFRKDIVDHLNDIENALGYKSDLLKQLRDLENAVRR